MKNALIKHITNFLMELGKGFSYVGRENRLVAGEKEKFIDLLFYIIPLHRYCVIEVKITEFDFPDLGQLAGYVAMVDDLMNTEIEKPAMFNRPMGISEYELVRQQLPDDLKKTLPSQEEIERGLMGK